MNIYRIFLILLLLSSSHLVAHEGLSSAMIGIDAGNWKPSALDAAPENPLRRVDGASYYIGLTGTTPSIGGFAVRFSVLQWQQSDLAGRTNKESVTLRLFSASLKNSIIPDSPLTPFVTFGLGTIWSREVPALSKGKVPLDRAGVGIDVGAGLDFLVRKNWALALEYHYIYAKFAKVVGLTDNYSGPKISLALNFLF